MEGVARLTDAIDHYDYASFLVKVAIEAFDRGDIHDCLEEYAIYHDLQIDELSKGDVDMIRNIMDDIAFHIG